MAVRGRSLKKFSVQKPHFLSQSARFKSLFQSHCCLFWVEVVSYFSSCGWKMSWRDVLSQSKVEKCFGAMQHSWQMTPRKSVYDLGGNLPATISDSQTLQAGIRRNIKRQILLCYSVLHPCQNRRQLLTLHGFAAIPFV